MYRIRKAEFTDVERLQALQFQINAFHKARLPDDFLSPEEIEKNINLNEFIDSHNYIVLVVEHDEGVAGFVMGNVWERKSWVLQRRQIASLQQIAVDTAHQRHGLGKMLVEAFEQEAKKKGSEELWLEVYAFNEDAIKLYKRQGIEPTLLFGQKRLT